MTAADCFEADLVCMTESGGIVGVVADEIFGLSGNDDGVGELEV